MGWPFEPEAEAHHFRKKNDTVPLPRLNDNNVLVCCYFYIFGEDHWQSIPETSPGLWVQWTWRSGVDGPFRPMEPRYTANRWPTAGCSSGWFDEFRSQRKTTHFLGAKMVETSWFQQMFSSNPLNPPVSPPFFCVLTNRPCLSLGVCARSANPQRDRSAQGPPPWGVHPVDWGPHDVIPQ